MNPRTTPQVARQAIFAIRGARYSSTAAAPESTSIAPEAQEEPSEPESKVGQQIYVYHHLQKNNVVYSFNRALKNSHALAQIPFNGKKTVPRALRKDLWHPLATLTFPTASPQIGLSTFQKLREYRRRHELEWDPELYKKDEEGKPIPKKKQGRLLADQKANSIADIAAVLNRLSTNFAEEAGEEDKSVGKVGLIGEGTGTEVKVEWSNPIDRGFAESWSSNVHHSTLVPHTNNRDPSVMSGESSKKERDAAKGVKLISQKEKRHAKYKDSKVSRPYICAAWHQSLPRSEKLALQEKARLSRERRREPEYQEKLKQQRIERYREKKRKENAPKRAEWWQSLSEEEKAAKTLEIEARKAAKEAKKQASLEKITV